MSRTRVRELHLQQIRIVETLNSELHRIKRIHEAAKTAAMALEMLDNPRDQQAAMALLEPYGSGLAPADGGAPDSLPDPSDADDDQDARPQALAPAALPGARAGVNASD